MTHPANITVAGVAFLALSASSQVVTPAVEPLKGPVFHVGDAAGRGSDPLRPEQWGLDALGIDQIPDLLVWQRQPRIAVHDTGVAPWHEDLPKFLAYAVAGWDPAQIDHFHATSMASDAAAICGNGVGMSGSAGAGAHIDSFKCLSYGSGTPLTVASSMMLGAAMGYRVHSISLQGPPDDWYEIAFALIDAYDGVAVVAAGNRPTSGVQWPGAHRRAICISALDPDLTLASYSSWGPQVDFCAPGTRITSAYPFGGMYSMDHCPDCYVEVDGTSPATALTAGVVARMLTEAPWMTRDEVYQALQYTCIDLGAPGFDWFYGHGMVNALAVDLVRWNRADCNRDGKADTFDVLQFVNWYDEDDYRADFDLDGAWTLGDFDLFWRELRLLGVQR